MIAAEQNAVTDEDRATREDQWIRQMRRDNFGFQEVKILEGNIGYLDLREFMDPKYAGETAVAAMNFLSNADVQNSDLGRGVKISVRLTRKMCTKLDGAQVTMAVLHSARAGPPSSFSNGVLWTG